MDNNHSLQNFIYLRLLLHRELFNTIGEEFKNSLKEVMGDTLKNIIEEPYIYTCFIDSKNEDNTIFERTQVCRAMCKVLNNHKEYIYMKIKNSNNKNRLEYTLNEVLAGNYIQQLMNIYVYKCNTTSNEIALRIYL